MVDSVLKAKSQAWEEKYKSVLQGASVVPAQGSTVVAPAGPVFEKFEEKTRSFLMKGMRALNEYLEAISVPEQTALLPSSPEVQHLLTAYEQYLGSLSFRPFLLPSTIVVDVMGLGCHINVKIFPNHTPINIVGKVREFFEARGDPIIDISQDTLLLLRPPISNSLETHECTKVSAFENAFTLYSLHPSGRVPDGWCVQLQGKVTLHSQRAVPCIKEEFEANKNMKQDYYHCRDCQKNWICKGCSESCHKQKGHSVQLMVKGHLPRFACCYCSKTAHGCSIFGHSPQGCSSGAEATGRLEAGVESTQL
jgi:hypothetical protein